jgi:asparagine synthetase B (glutamine-hydrolysing)
VLNIEIIPTKQIINSSKYDNKSYNYKAICIFSALGFFLDDDTYFEGEKVLKPATNYIFKDNKIVDSVKYFKWNYSPRDINLRQATEEFTELFESIVKEQIDNRTVILPLSGGLDSRTQAAALKNIGANVNAYSYCFLNGHKKNIVKE